MRSEFVKGDRVKLTADGAEYGLAGECQVVTKYTYTEDDDSPFKDMREFFVEGTQGTVEFVYSDSIGTKYLIRFDNDPVDERMWWHWDDEIAKVVE